MKWRIYCLLVFFGLSGSIIVGRLFDLQILRHDHYVEKARKQHGFFKEISPRRGEIFFKEKYSSDGVSLAATHKSFPLLYAVPEKIIASLNGDENKLAELSRRLGEILKMEEQVVFSRLNKPEDPYEPLKHKLESGEAEAVESLGMEGLYLEDEKWRWYLSPELAPHLMGFVGFRGDEKIGRYGVEEYYDYFLSGKAGYSRGERDSIGRLIALFSSDSDSVVDGADLYLTVDQNIQFKIREELKKVMEKWGAESGSVIVMEPETGAILGMVSLPDYNPNNYEKVEDMKLCINPAVETTYEPGSIFKPITMAAGLDSGKVTPQTTYTDTGIRVVGGYSIKNAGEKSYGLQTMTQVLEKSLNTGAMFVEDTVGDELFRQYVEKFGFGKKTDVDLVGELDGNISNLNKNRKINFATASFGQGIAVTPLQMITAISAIANGGNLMKPHVVEKIAYKNGQTTEIKPEIIGQPISAETADKLSAMLVNVVENGYDKKAKISGYYVAGKTGTAQIPDPKGGYLPEGEAVHSFVGFAPAFDARFSILISITKPKGIRFASDSLSPVFRSVTRYLLDYYEILPTREVEKK